MTTDGLPTAVCYDAARGVSYPRPRLRGVLHQVSFVVSLVTGALLVSTARGATATTAAGVYAASVTGLFAASALYHWTRLVRASRSRTRRWTSLLRPSGCPAPANTDTDTRRTTVSHQHVPHAEQGN